MSTAGFDIKPGEHPIVPVILYAAPLAQEFAAKLLEEGIYVIGFFFPVVPKEKAHIRVQTSTARDRSHLDHAVKAFVKVGQEWYYWPNEKWTVATFQYPVTLSLPSAPGRSKLSEFFPVIYSFAFHHLS